LDFNASFSNNYRYLNDVFIQVYTINICMESYVIQGILIIVVVVFAMYMGIYVW